MNIAPERHNVICKNDILAKHFFQTLKKYRRVFPIEVLQKFPNNVIITFWSYLYDVFWTFFCWLGRSKAKVIRSKLCIGTFHCLSLLKKKLKNTTGRNTTWGVFNVKTMLFFRIKLHHIHDILPR